MTATVHTDGAARGNPGPAAWAYILKRPGQPPVEAAARMGTATNNVAEYTALVRALAKATELGVTELQVFSDSELMVKQMNGEYRVKHPDLQPLYAEAGALRKKVGRVTFTHVRRGQNADADRLCNVALDGGPKPAKVVPADGAEPRRSPDALEAEGVALLNAVAVSWAKHGPGHPPAVEVWDKIVALVRQHGHTV